MLKTIHIFFWYLRARPIEDQGPFYESVQVSFSLRSRKLRKYFVTTAQVLSLGEEPWDWLAGHLGQVHRDFDHLYDETIELAKVTELLIAENLLETMEVE